MSWKLSIIGSKTEIEDALDARDNAADWDENFVLTAFEVDPDQPDLWQLDGYLANKPGSAERKAIKALFAGNAPSIATEELPETDWVTESQKGVEPIRAGRFHVHTPDHSPSTETGVTSFCIPAAQAFGTGQHETTAGCLTMLDTMKRDGLMPRHIADIGTGTGLLAFAARTLWPAGFFTASDIDPLCAVAVVDNGIRNGVPIGAKRGEIAPLVADGMDDAALHARAPYDLLIANILAGPLIDMAPDFAKAVAPRGSILLSGLLETQEAAVRAAYHRVGFRFHKRLINGDWAILWLRRRSAG